MAKRKKKGPKIFGKGGVRLGVQVVDKLDNQPNKGNTQPISTFKMRILT